MRKKDLIRQKHSVINPCYFNLGRLGIVQTKNAPRTNPEALVTY